VAAGTQKPAGDTSPAFRIRPARRGDVEAIAALMSELGYPNAPDSATVHWVLSHPEIEVIVACDPMDKPVGMITLSHRPQLRLKGRIVTIDELVVLPHWRRRRVGRELMRRALDRAKVLSAKRVEVVTHKPRGDSVKSFYEACGFTESVSFVMRHVELDFQRR
jgi:predicted N-acetyltransferase YhbS